MLEKKKHEMPRKLQNLHIWHSNLELEHYKLSERLKILEKEIFETVKKIKNYDSFNINDLQKALDDMDKKESFSNIDKNLKK